MATGFTYRHYILKDHLGSWTTITDAEGNVEQELSFDAWGNLRDADTWTGTGTEAPMFDRGYTGHEHMTAFGLINMKFALSESRAKFYLGYAERCKLGKANGRCYDPTMSSFLSVDEYVQDPSNAQNFNRYAYCLNNPLKYTDPSGWMYLGASHSQECEFNRYRRYVNAHLTEEQWANSGINRTILAYVKMGVGYIMTPFMMGEEQKGGGGGETQNGFFDSYGKYIGSDGKYEGKIYVVYNVKNDKEKVPRGESYKDAVTFIKQNDGNVDAFTDGCIAYQNSMEIPDYESRVKMIMNVSEDTGKPKDASKDSNNTEYGGSIENLDVVYKSAVGSPMKEDIIIELPANCSTYHSHPSGTIYKQIGGNVGGADEFHWYNQFPSITDISNAGNFNHFVIGMGGRNVPFGGYVYGYNASGTHIQISIKTFTNPNLFKLP